MGASSKAIDAATDIAMVGLWDRSFDRETLEEPPSIPDLHEEARAARLFLIETTADGSYPTRLLVQEELPPELADVMIPSEQSYGLRAPSGTLCYGGVEDYRSEIKSITSDEDELEVEPGDYAVRFHVLDTERPECELKRHLGEADFAFWKRNERRLDRSCLAVLVVFFASIFVGLAYGWWAALGLDVLAVLAWVLLEMWMSRDPRCDSVASRIREFSGGREFEEYREEFYAQHPVFVLQLRRVENAARPAGGVFRWDREDSPDALERA